MPIPSVTSPVADRNGAFTKPWRDFFLRLAAASDNARLAAELAELADRVTHLEESDDLSALILGLGSVRVYGTLESGTIRIQLENDTQAPGVTYFYGTGPTGARGWHRIYDSLAAGEGIAITDSGYTVLGEVGTAADLPGTGNTGEAWRVLEPAGLYAWDGAAFTLDTDATGIVGFALEPLPDTGIGAALVKITRDAYGRVEGTEAATTDDLPEGLANLYFTAARVRATVLTGLSLVTATAITAADTVLSALGKLQAQITTLASSLSGYVPTSRTIATTAPLSGGGDLSANRTLAISAATTGAAGSMSAADKTKLNGIATGATAYTDALARAAVITSSITDGDTTHSPSGDAVFDALAGKFDNTGGTVTGATSFNSNTTFRNHSPELIVQGVVQGFRASAYGTSPQFIMSAAGGTEGAPSATPAGTELGSFSFRGHTGSGGTGSKGYVSVITTENWTPTANGTALSLRTTLTGSTTLSTRMQIDGSGNILPGTDNSQSIGNASTRPSQLFAVSGTINTSDAREKTAVAPLTESEIAAAKQLAGEIGTFQWIASIEAKGVENARHHVGLTVQRCIEVMRSHGLDPFRYAFICYDEWPETPEQSDPDTGEVTQEYRPTGNRYSLRPDQLALFLARGFDARLKALEG